MNSIHLQQTLPNVFADRNRIDSELWHHDLRFERGRHYLVEAASGTGKSSLCSYLYGYRDDYQGLILFDEENIRQFTTNQWTDLRRRHLSLLFQELRIFPELTVLENIRLKNRLTGHKTEKEIKQMIEALGLTDKLHERMLTLSYGQQQRVAFVRALCQPFDFILLDEPISHLDATNARIMTDMLLAEAEKQGAGIITTSIGNHLDMAYDQVLKL